MVCQKPPAGPVNIPSHVASLQAGFLQNSLVTTSLVPNWS